MEKSKAPIRSPRFPGSGVYSQAGDRPTDHRKGTPASLSKGQTCPRAQDLYHYECLSSRRWGHLAGSEPVLVAAGALVVVVSAQLEG